MICFSEECDELTNPEHGYVLKIGNVPGEKAFYLCHEGFMPE